MSVRIDVTITGDLDTKAMLMRIRDQIDPGVIQPEIDAIANDLRTEMISRMHTVSGAMRNSTRVVPTGKGKSVQVGVPYAMQENQRPGVKKGKKGSGQGTSHNFLEPSLAAIQNQGLQRLTNRIDSFLRSV